MHETPLSTSSREKDWTHRQVDVGEVRLHVVEAGKAGGALVILLHGFPEFWWSWRHQIPALAAAGYHVVAPDMRGYNLSDKPREVKAYRAEHLVADVAGLIRSYGKKKAIVIGHDWGAGVAWLFAMEHPEMIDRLGILNVPHPREMLRGLRHIRQLKKSWYMFFFQLPKLPERMLSKDNFAYLRRVFAGYPREDVDRYVEAASHAEGMTGPLNYYRAAIRGAVMGRVPKYRRIDAPVLVIWGEEDDFLGKEMATPDPSFVPRARVEFLKDASHWVQIDAPDRVNALLLDFLREPRS